MCRLAAYHGPPAPLAPLVFDGAPPLAQQAWAPGELLHGSVNADGWGVAWAGPQGWVRTAGAEPIWYDPDLPDLLGAISSRCALAVLRNATPGLPVGGAGLLPFVLDGWAFALNGFVPGFRERHMRALRAELTDRSYARLVGVSDAETLFLRVLERMAEGDGPVDAMVSVRQAVAARLDPGEAAPLTMVMAGADGVFALNSSTGGPVNSLYLGRGAQPLPEGVLLASERLGEGEWQPIPAHSAVSITAAGVEMSERPLP